jgi:asparagine synthase (glutamine-hydrolysing)
MLTKVDRMTMAHGLEARVPFLDDQLVAWSFHLPHRWKLHGTNGKIVVKSAVSGLLPETVIRRPKHGFNLPIRLWLKGRLRDWARDLLAPGNLQRRGIFDPAAVQAFLENTDRSPEDRSNQVLIMVMLERWFQIFIDSPRAVRP